MTYHLRTLALPAVLAGTLVLASCGTSSSGGHDASGMSSMSPATTGATAASRAPATGARSAADVAFATGMIPHHAQAVEMAGIALRQATNAELKVLAPKIEEAQGPEIVSMSGWLKGWGAPIPAIGGGHEMSGMTGMSDMPGMGGMMSAQEMTGLRKATGPAFDRMWLRMMTRHHQGAVAMARTEVAHGTSPQAKLLAASIIESQTTEIAQMSSILTQVPG